MPAWVFCMGRCNLTLSSAGGTLPHPDRGRDQNAGHRLAVALEGEGRENRDQVVLGLQVLGPNTVQGGLTDIKATGSGRGGGGGGHQRLQYPGCALYACQGGGGGRRDDPDSHLTNATKEMIQLLSSLPTCHLFGCERGALAHHHRGPGHRREHQVIVLQRLPL